MTQVAGAVPLLALAVVVASLVYLHIEPTGLSPLRNAVSQYGITSFKAGYRVATTPLASRLSRSPSASTRRSKARGQGWS